MIEQQKEEKTPVNNAIERGDEPIDQNKDENSNIPNAIEQGDEPIDQNKDENSNIPNAIKENDEPNNNISGNNEDGTLNKKIIINNKDNEIKVSNIENPQSPNENDNTIKTKKELDIENSNQMSKDILSEYGINRSDGILTNPEKKRFNSKGIGAVVYMEPENYETGEKIENIHINAAKFEIYNAICDLFFPTKKNILKYGIIGHEHGSKLKKCHYQCGFIFTDKLNMILSPGKFTIRNITYLVMFQSVQNPNAIMTYCKKEHDYTILGEGNGLQSKESKTCSGIFTKILSNNNLTKKEIIELVKNEGDEEDKKYFLYGGEKLLNNYTNMIKINEKPAFEWRFPEHMRDQTLDTEKVAVYNLIYKWFQEECVPEKTFRRKALVLFSMRRACGKTEFAKRLVPHPDYYIYCRSSINGQQFEKKESEARLVILDDLYPSTSAPFMEMMKALVSGESTDLQSKYCQHFFDKNLPTIICTNNIKLYKMYKLDPMFRTQCYVIGFNFYIGPPGTEPEKLNKIDAYETEEISRLLGEKTERE